MHCKDKCSVTAAFSFDKNEHSSPSLKYVLGSSARFARAEACEIRLWDYITGLYCGIILQDEIVGLYYGITLRHITKNHITG